LEDSGVEAATGGGGEQGLLNAAGLTVVVDLEVVAGLSKACEFEDGFAGAEALSGAKLSEVDAADGEVFSERAWHYGEALIEEAADIFGGDQEDCLEGTAVDLGVTVEIAFEAEGAGPGLGDGEFRHAAFGDAELFDNALHVSPV